MIQNQFLTSDSVSSEGNKKKADVKPALSFSFQFYLFFPATTFIAAAFISTAAFW